MKTKKDIVDNWLVRYTGVELEDFGQYILLTNFDKYITYFSELTGAEIRGLDKNMRSATAQNITIINFGMEVQMLQQSWTYCLPSTRKPFYF